MKSLLLSTVLVSVCSCACAAWADDTVTSTRAPVRRQFHAKALLLDGQGHVALPAAEAEYLLWLYTDRVPSLEHTVAVYDRLDRLQTEQAANSANTIAILSRTATQAVALADMWKLSAETLEAAQETSWLEDIAGPGGSHLWTTAALIGGILIGRELAN
jgi:hypothetical protein